MTKAELIAALSDATSLPKTTVQNVLDALTNVTRDQLSEGNELTIPGIVKIGAKDKAARTGRNPRTGEAVEIPAKRVATFKAVKSLI